jgi:hypothetical protein
MARPFNQGLKYMQLDTDIYDTPKFDKLESKYGDSGLIFVYKLWGKIYSNSLFWELEDDEVALYCKKRAFISVEKFYEMLKVCIDYKIFDKKMFETHNIITSKGIQRRYLQITSRWKRVTIVEEYMIKSVDISSYHLFVYNKTGNLIKEIHPVDVPGSAKKTSLSEKQLVQPTEKKQEPAVIESKKPTPIPQVFVNEPPEISVVEVDSPKYGMVSTAEVRDFCKLNYDTQNDTFKDNVSKKWFESFRVFNEEIDNDFVNLRNSSYQINYEQFCKLFSEPIDSIIPKKPEVLEALEKLSGNGVKLDFRIFIKLKAYIKIVRSDKLTSGYRNGNGSSVPQTRTGFKIDHSNLPK